MMLNTYIIHLKKSTARYEYITNLLYRYDFLNVEYIDAVDGRLMMIFRSGNNSIILKAIIDTVEH